MIKLITIRTKEFHIKLLIESLDVQTHSKLTKHDEAFNIIVENQVSSLTAALKNLEDK